jgi:hypothetical protein
MSALRAFYTTLIFPVTVLLIKAVQYFNTGVASLAILNGCINGRFKRAASKSFYIDPVLPQSIDPHS